MSLTSAAASAALEFHLNELPQVEAEFSSRVNQDLEVIKKGVKRALESYKAKLFYNSSDLTKNRYLFGLADFFARLEGIEARSFIPNVTADTMFFMKFYIAIHDSLQATGQKRLVRQFTGLLTGNGSLSELLSELMIPLVYARAGGNVALTDFEGGKPSQKTFEFLVEKEGRCLEVEVKTLSIDSGHPESGRSLEYMVRRVTDHVNQVGTRLHDTLIMLHIMKRQSSFSNKIVPAIEYCVSNFPILGGDVCFEPVKLSVKQYETPIQLSVAIQRARSTGRLRRHLPISLERRVYLLIDYEESWSIGKIVDDKLKSASEKFSGDHAAVTWLRFPDMVAVDAACAILPHYNVFSDQKVRRAIQEHLREGKFSYSSSIVISPEISYRHRGGYYQMQVGVCSLGLNGQLSLEHEFFLPMRFPVEHVPIYTVDPAKQPSWIKRF